MFSWRNKNDINTFGWKKAPLSPAMQSGQVHASPTEYDLMFYISSNSI